MPATSKIIYEIKNNSELKFVHIPDNSTINITGDSNIIYVNGLYVNLTITGKNNVLKFIGYKGTVSIDGDSNMLDVNNNQGSVAIQGNENKYALLSQPTLKDNGENNGEMSKQEKTNLFDRFKAAFPEWFAVKSERYDGNDSDHQSKKAKTEPEVKTEPNQDLLQQALSGSDMNPAEQDYDEDHGELSNAAVVAAVNALDLSSQIS